MTWLRMVLLVSSVSWLLAPAALADDDDDFARNGWYIGVSGVLGIENFEGSSAHDLTGGFDLRAGYRATSIFSFEIEGAYLVKFPYQPGRQELASNILTGQPPNLTNRGQTGFETDVGLWQITGNLKASAPLAGLGESYLLQRLQPFGLLGLGLYNAKFTRRDSYGGDYDHTGPIAKLGVGVDYYLTRKLVIAAEADYNWLFNTGRSLDYFGLALGVYYRF